MMPTQAAASTESAPAPSSISITAIVVVLLIARTTVNVTRRFAYPFLPSIARSLGVPLGSVQSVLAVQAASGVAAPLAGPLADRYGRKRMMTSSLLLIVVAGTVGALVPSFGVFAGVMLLFGVAKWVLDPALQAYLAEIVPFSRRGRAIGAVELSWSLGLVVGAPVAAIGLALGGMQVVFGAIALMTLLALILLHRRLPSDAPTGQIRMKAISPLAAVRIVSRSKMALLALGYSVMLSASNEIIFITYAAWFAATFGVAEAALGVTALAIAAAEIVGEVSVIQLADRFGKRRLALLAMVCAALSYGVLPLLVFSLPLAVLWLFVMFIGVETAIVASFPLFTEVLPEARAAMMSAIVSAHSVGRLTGAALGGALFVVASYGLVGVVSMVIGLGAVGCIWALRLDEQAV